MIMFTRSSEKIFNPMFIILGIIIILVVYVVPQHIFCLDSCEEIDAAQRRLNGISSYIA